MPNVNPGPASSSNPNSLLTAVPVNTQTNSAALLTNGSRLLAVGRAINVNATGDTAILPIINASTYAVEIVIWTNASTSLTTATAGVFTAAAGAGTGVVAAATALSGLTAANVVGKPTVVAATLLLALTAQNLYVNIGTAQGAAATMDLFVYGFDLS